MEGGINLFAYVSNRPINFVDPLGLFWGEIFGNKPGDIFTMGYSHGGILGVFGFGFSFDRVIMPDGKASWFFTFGGGLAGGATVSVDRGKIFRFDPCSSKKVNYDFTKSDIEGFSVSGSLDLAKGIGIGGEGAISPRVYRPVPEHPDMEYASPLITLKGGLRFGTTGGSLFGNYTWHIGE